LRRSPDEEIMLSFKGLSACPKDVQRLLWKSAGTLVNFYSLGPRVTVKKDRVEVPTCNTFREAYTSPAECVGFVACGVLVSCRAPDVWRTKRSCVTAVQSEYRSIRCHIPQLRSFFVHLHPVAPSNTLERAIHVLIDQIMHRAPFLRMMRSA
jgi:hypothetical protein